ncbi:condensation domain-containing protein [Clostridium estertheticum]|uniref:condensation domain-containing protein n=1 Tax=Clostridium estertheticum TaxID=238834 RepID=UPI001C0D670A|nr:condensation domain-containing protein [Clostridium estertheticum]MBU3198529.1 hypothetical protein [Clostridium estertheticum]WAG64510.1 condensation domain-containing protein [Clostridium estertheticum]
MNEINKLDSNNVEDILTLSPMQEGMIFHYLCYPDNNLNFAQLCYKLKNKVDKEVLKKAWQVEIKRNEMLRVVFRWKKFTRPVQIVLKSQDIPFREYDFSDIDKEQAYMKIEKIIKEDTLEKIDISKHCLRINLCKVTAEEYIMIVSSYNIIYDGWSNGILLKELIDCYDELYGGNKPKEIAKIKYKEFLMWIKKRNTNEEEKYWKRYLEGYNCKMENFSEIQSNSSEVENKSYKHKISAVLEEQITKYIVNEQITLATLIYTAWAILLFKNNNINDVVFGMTVSGRPSEVKGINNIVGLFINTIPLRVKIFTTSKINELIKTVKNILVNDEIYHYTPLAEIKNYSEINNLNDLFDSIVVMQNYPLDQELLNNKHQMNIEVYSLSDSTNFPVTVGITTYDGIKLDIRYSTKYCTEYLIEDLIIYFIEILKGITGNNKNLLGNLEVKDIEVLDKKNKKEILKKIEYKENMLQSIERIDLNEIF